MKSPRYASFFAVLSVILMFSGAAAGAPPGTPEERGMRQVATNVYVDPDMTSDRAKELLPLLAEARGRVAAFYGEVVARPNIIFCATADCYRSFGAIGLGFTDGTNVIISPQGQCAAIIAHELAHMELSARVGGFAKVLERIPQWFDEGQAVIVSQAEEFSEEAWKKATRNGADAPSLSSLQATTDWNRITGPHGENMQFSYGTARREVGRWFGAAGLPGFHALLSALSSDDAFDAAYSRIEGTHSHGDSRDSHLVVSADSGPPPGKSSASEIPSEWTSRSGGFVRASW